MQQQLKETALDILIPQNFGTAVPVPARAKRGGTPSPPLFVGFMAKKQKTEYKVDYTQSYLAQNSQEVTTTH